MQGQPRRSGPWRRIAVGTAILVVGPIVVFIAAMFVTTMFIEAEPAWTAASGQPVPADFLYAMFPMNATVTMYDTPDGVPVGVLARAVVNSQEEIDAGGWIRVLNPAGDTWVRLSELAYLPPPGANVDYFAAFAAGYSARIGDEFGRASVKLENANAGTTSVTLRLGRDDYAQRYEYEVANGLAVPKKYVRSGIGDALRAAGISLSAMVLYEVLAIGAIVARMVRRRGKQLS